MSTDTTADLQAYLEWQNLTNLVKEIQPPSSWLLSRVPQTPWPYPSAVWDYIDASTKTRAQISSGFLYLREKKVFEPTTIRWLRTPGDLGATNATASVTREVSDLSSRFDNFAELMLWRALTGLLVLDFPDMTARVNYRFSSSHLPVPTKPWNEANYNEIMDQVESWSKIIRDDCGLEPRDVFLPRSVMNRIIAAYKRADIEELDDARVITREMREDFKTKGVMSDLLGLTWSEIPSVGASARPNVPNSEAHISLRGTPASSTAYSLAPENAFYMGDYSTNRPVELYVGPSADDSAPVGFTGKFVKSWKDLDPSARQVLMEWSVVPVISRPAQMIYCSNVNSTEPDHSRYCPACNQLLPDA